MKKLILSMVLAVFMALPLLADDSGDYVPIVREGVEWGHKVERIVPIYVDDMVGYGGYMGDYYIFYREQLKGDTVINGKTYKKCYRYRENELDLKTANLISFMREEDKKVYFMVNSEYSREANWGVDNGAHLYLESQEESLVYDMNVKVGEFFKTGSLYNFDYVVESITDTIIGGKHRRVFNFKNSSDKFIEGFGLLSPFLGDFGIPFQDIPASTFHNVQHVTYEKNIGGDIVLKTEDFDGNDPMLNNHKYIPVVREGIEWGHKAVISDDNGKKTVFYREQLKGDTIIEGVTYKKCYRYTGSKLDTATASLISFMREEDRTVYIRVNTDASQLGRCGLNDAVTYGKEREAYIYDFRTETSPNLTHNSAVSNRYMTYRNMTFTKIGETNRRQYETYEIVEKNNSYINKSILIEGIGAIEGYPCDFGLPYQQQQDNEARYITYEKNVGGEIVYKTEYFDANDPAIRPEGVAKVSDGAADVPVYGTEGAAVIDGDGVGYAVYSADGLQVATGIADGKTVIPLPSGLYIVRTGSRATKIAVK